MDDPRLAVIIEDDQDIRELVSLVLNQSGFEVHATDSGMAGVEAVRVHNPAIVTLDLGLPDIDGFEVARRIRLFSDAYIIMLTGRSDEMDTLLGLESGADDYLTKPFRPRELRARVSAMLRRPRVAPELRQTPAPPVLPNVAHTATPVPNTGGKSRHDAVKAPGLDPAEAHGAVAAAANGLTLNKRTRTVTVDGAELELTRTEFDLLHALVDGVQQVRTKSDLVRWLRGDAYDAGTFISDADERTIEVHMANLRRKLGDNPRSPRWIKTVRGVGYRLVW